MNKHTFLQKILFTATALQVFVVASEVSALSFGNSPECLEMANNKIQIDSFATEQKDAHVLNSSSEGEITFSLTNKIDGLSKASKPKK
jgi:hypothetical protein